MTITRIKEILDQYNITPLASLSQNFFLDTPLLKKALSKAGLDTSPHIVEIGPGLGSLTEVLLDKTTKLTAFELDATLARILPEILNHPSNLQVHHQNILDAGETFKTFTTTYDVIANIPYNITGSIIRFLLTQPHKPRSITLLIQKEVAKNLTNTLAPLSLQRFALELYGQATILQTVPPESFWPRPAVDSAFIQIIPTTTYDQIDREAVLQFAKPAFQWKRKQLATSLSKHHHTPRETIIQTLKEMDLPATDRPEDLTTSQWVSLVQRLQL